MKATPLAVGGVLDKTDRPLAAAVWFDWAALVERPGLGGFRRRAGRGLQGRRRGPAEGRSSDQVHTALDVLKTLRTISNESYFEDEVLVNHTLLEIRDVEK